MEAINVSYYLSPFGKMELGAYKDQLCLCNWHDKKNKLAVHRRLKKYISPDLIESSDPIFKETTAQLDHYFNGTLTHFTLPLLFAGTEFQKKVWQALLDIPYGSTASYQQLAKNLGHEHAYRAVANANAANALSIIVPCHRIIGQNGKLTGYAGGLEIKQQLLQLERKN